MGPDARGMLQNIGRRQFDTNLTGSQHPGQGTVFGDSQFSMLHRYDVL
jgi:hypothetical protein